MEQPQEREDLVIKCSKCGGEFTWTAGEQRFYNDKGLFTPKHCKACLQADRENVRLRKEENEKRGMA